MQRLPSRLNEECTKRAVGARCRTHRHGHTSSHPPAPAQGAPTGSLPHAGPILQLPGAGAWPQWPQNPRVCNRDRKTKKRNQDSPTPKEGWGSGASHSPTAELSFPTLHRAAQGSAPHRSLASPSPALQATGGGRGGGGQPGGRPLHLGRHVRASQSRLQVGIHHGFTVWRLDVVGSFLELQQHGHLWGAARGTQPGILALPKSPPRKRGTSESKAKPGRAANPSPPHLVSWP